MLMVKCAVIFPKEENNLENLKTMLHNYGEVFCVDEDILNETHKDVWVIYVDCSLVRFSLLKRELHCMETPRYVLWPIDS